MTLAWDTRTPAERGWPARDVNRLFLRCAAGDTAAREAIILRYLPYARSLAHRYAGRGQPLDDLYQAASIGLIRAVDRYSLDRHRPFLAFAKPAILGEIQRHFRDAAWSVHVPRPLQDRARAVAKVDDRLLRETGRVPSVPALAQAAGLEPGEVTEARAVRKAFWPASLDAAPSAEAVHAGVLAGPDREYERVEERAELAAALRKLPPRERRVVLMRFGGEHSQSEIGRRIGVSQMHVSRILRSAGMTLAGALEAC